MTSPLLAFTGFALQLLSLSIWIGGLVFFAFVASRLAFRVMNDRGVAGDYVAACLRRFQGTEVTCALLTLCGAGFLYVAQVPSPALWLDVSLALLMFVIFAVYGGILFPKVDSLRLEIRDAELYGREIEPAIVQSFHELHTWHARLMGLNMMLGVGMLLVLTFLAMKCGQGQSVEAFDASLFGGTFAQWP